MIKSSQLSNLDLKDIVFEGETGFSLERFFLKKGARIIAGVDEAGRGALAGPLSVGLVIFSEDTILDPQFNFTNTITDSKKLSQLKREAAIQEIERLSIVSHVKFVSPKTIDRLNINGATEYAVASLLAELPVKPDLIIMDGNFKFKLNVPFVPVIKGDLISYSIAAASICAKVARDNLMNRMSNYYPEYKLALHKGYGTKLHRMAIESCGPAVIHRRSYEPVKSMCV